MKENEKFPRYCTILSFTLMQKSEQIRNKKQTFKNTILNEATTRH